MEYEPKTDGFNPYVFGSFFCIHFLSWSKFGIVHEKQMFKINNFYALTPNTRDTNNVQIYIRRGKVRGV